MIYSTHRLSSTGSFIFTHCLQRYGLHHPHCAQVAMVICKDVSALPPILKLIFQEFCSYRQWRKPRDYQLSVYGFCMHFRVYDLYARMRWKNRGQGMSFVTKSLKFSPLCIVLRNNPTNYPRLVWRTYPFTLHTMFTTIWPEWGTNLVLPSVGEYDQLSIRIKSTKKWRCRQGSLHIMPTYSHDTMKQNYEGSPWNLSQGKLPTIMTDQWIPHVGANIEGEDITTVKIMHPTPLASPLWRDLMLS